MLLLFYNKNIVQMLIIKSPKLQFEKNHGLGSEVTIYFYTLPHPTTNPKTLKK